MDGTGATTIDLLRAWRDGRRDALRDLVVRHLAWVARRVRRRRRVRERLVEETQDVVQDVVVNVMRTHPLRSGDDPRAFRALLARIVDHRLIDRGRFFRRGCRDRARESARASDTQLALEPAVRDVTRPSEVFAQVERRERVRAALDALEPAEREVIHLRTWEGLEFAAIARRLGVAEDAARMRYRRALGRLARRVGGS